MNRPIRKYQRTPHLEGSRLQKGDSDHDQVRYRDLVGRWIVVEEKVDGANSAFSFPEAEPMLQSRGHSLGGRGDERQFSRLKSWFDRHQERFFDRFYDRYIVYGEHCQVKHTIFYDRLPHYFLEFDIHDLETGKDLSTTARRQLIGDLPIVSVPILYAGPAPSKLEDLLAMIGPSLCQSSDRAAWRDALLRQSQRSGHDIDRTLKETAMTDVMEGLYIKLEEGDETVGRLKWVNPWFLQTIMDSESHHANRIIVENCLAPDVDIMAEHITWDVPGKHDILPAPISADLQPNL